MDHGPGTTEREHDHGDSEDPWFDRYLDALLAGEQIEPAEFCGRHALDPGAAEDLQRAWQLVAAKTQAPTAAPAPQAEVGLPVERLGEYRLLHLLGEGGMGCVYLAQQEPLGRLCALKLIRPERMGSTLAQARFEREARLASLLRHPGLATVLGFGREQGHTYLAMEYVEGVSLDERIANLADRGERLDPREAVQMAASIARALEAAHAEGVLHRDVKPGNVRLSEGGGAVLLDFGVARQVDSASLTLTGPFVGTPSYAAPEQLQGKELDGRSDVFSLGATLYEALTGRAPFPGDSLEAVMQQILHQEPTPPARLGLSLPRDLTNVLRKALEKERNQRYAGAREFAEDLEAILELRPVQAHPLGFARRTRRWVRRHAVVAGMFSATLLVSGGFLLRQSWQEHQQVRSDRVESLEIVRAARQVVRDWSMGRLDRDRARGVRAQFQDQSELGVLGAPLVQAAMQAADTLAAARAKRVDFDQVALRLHEAERLDPQAPGLSEAYAALYYERWLDVRDDRTGPQAQYFADLVRRYDPDGSWTEKVAGRARLMMESTPPATEVHVFRYVDLRDGPATRVVPVPDGSTAEPDPRWALEVTEPAGELDVGDLVIEVAGHPIRGSVLVLTAQAPLRPGDRLVALSRRAIEDLADVPVSVSPRPLVYRFSRAGEEFELEGTSLADWETTLGDARAALAELSLPILCWRAGREERIEAGPLAGLRTSAAPLRESAQSLVPQSEHGGPPTFEAKEPGWYLALFEAPGYEPLRVSFHIDHACEWYFDPQGVHLTPELIPAGSVPADFVRIPIGALPRAELNFWIQRTEVTCGEYLAFLNDTETRGQPVELSQRWVPADPRAEAEGSLWPQGSAGFELPAGMPADWPVLGVSWEGAWAYADWYGRQPTARASGLEFDLPSQEEWRWAAYGGDGGDYVFGDEFDPRWVNGRFSKHRVAPEPVGSYPVDESPFGVLDLTGSAREWCRDGEQGSGGSRRHLCGGSWLDSSAADFLIRADRIASILTRDPGVGFRLVARRPAESDEEVQHE